jgi:hypothetical protein
MRNYFALLFISVFLSACGGGGSAGSAGGNPSGLSIPVGSVSGIGFDGLLINSDISIYDFTSGTKGALLGHAVSDTSGLYKISLQSESRPILVEASGGYYMEEAGSGFQVKLTTKHRLTAVANYTMGAIPRVSTTNYTHLAAGLAAYNISKGAVVATAINEANNRVSAMLGVDILTTTPLQITDPANASASLTSELRYGFLSGAISMWTYNNTPANGLAHKTPYTSIDFAQLMYQDVLADGILDGSGFDASGKVAQLSFGTTTLTTDTYRLGLGVSMLQMANNANNKTGLNGASVLPFVQSIIASTDSVFNNVVPTAIAAPVVNITTPAANAAWLNTVNVLATTSTASVLSSVELLVDGVSVATATNPAAPIFSVVTSTYPDGAHTVGVRATDIGGLVTTKTVPVLIVNQVPSVTLNAPAANAVISGTTAVTATNASTVGLNKVELLVDGVSVATAAANLLSPSFSLDTALYTDGAHTVGVRATDIGGQVVTTTHAITIANFAPAVTITYPASAALLRGSLMVAATATSTAGLSSVALLVDGVTAATAANIAAPSMQLITTNFPDGAHTISVRATDIGGRASTQTIPVVFDNVAPVVNITTPTVGSIMRGAANVTATTSSLAGVAKNELLVDSLLVATATSLTSPSFSLNTALYQDGTRAIGVRSTDIGGLVTTSTAQVFLSNVVPVVNITAPAANAVLSTTASVTATTQSTIGLSKVELLVDGVVAAAATNLVAPMFNLNITGYIDGAHTIGVRATDIGGLVTTRTISVVIANVPPNVTISSPASGAMLRGVATVSGTAQSGAGVASVDLLVDGVLFATAASATAPSFSLNTTAYADGAHVLAIRATDVGARVTTTTIPVAFSNVAPVVSITGPANGAWGSKTLNVTTATQSVAGLSSVQLLVDNALVSSSTTASPTFALVTTTYTEGVHTISVKATDIYGLVTTSSMTLNIDNTPPTLTGTGGYACPAKLGLCSSYHANGTVADNLSGVASLTIIGETINAVAVADAALAVGAGGAWSRLVALSTVSQDSLNPGLLRVRDAAGNCSDYIDTSVMGNMLSPALVRTVTAACP